MGEGLVSGKTSQMKIVQGVSNSPQPRWNPDFLPSVNFGAQTAQLCGAQGTVWLSPPSELRVGWDLLGLPAPARVEGDRQTLLAAALWSPHHALLPVCCRPGGEWTPAPARPSWEG